MTVDMNAPVVERLTDTDLYKFTMQQVALHRFPTAVAEYEFKCRNSAKAKFPLAELKPYVDQQLDMLCELRMQPDELEFMAQRPYFKSDYIDYLEMFQLRRKFIKTEATKDGNLKIRASGPMVNSMMFEIYTIEIVQELYFRTFWTKELEEEGMRRLDAKCDWLLEAIKRDGFKANPFDLFEFGARRRASRAWQSKVVARLKERLACVLRGTSNVNLAREYGLVPIGTMAHEYFQAHQALGSQLVDFQKMALENWVMEYRGDLGIALTDTINSDAFFKDCDLFFAKLFDGFRHDSGDPYVWGEKALNKLAELKINPMTKRLVFSDSLDFQRAWDLYQAFGDRVQTGFGIGTNLSNDMGVEALNLVMKMVRCNNKPVAKISDAPGKVMCEDESFLAYLKYVFNVQD